MTATTHCQICARPIKANTGRIALHGYQRPGHGWQTASCYGARCQPYEVANDALLTYAKMLLGIAAARTDEIGRLQAPDATFMYGRFGRNKREFGPTDPLYQRRKEERIRALEGERRQILAEAARANERYAAWTPQTNGAI
jgi:hypothetical protein